MAIDLKPEMLLYQFKTPTLTNSFYMIIMTESSCNVKYIYLKQYVYTSPWCWDSSRVYISPGTGFEQWLIHFGLSIQLDILFFHKYYM